MQIETKYLIREKDRHGNIRIYFRRKPGRRIRIRAEEGTPEFLLAVAQAARGETSQPIAKRTATVGRVLPGTLRDLIVAYYKSPEFTLSLEKSTQKARRYILDKFCAEGGENDKPPYGDRSVAGIEPRHLREVRDERAAKVSMANQLIKDLRQVFAYGLEAGIPYVKSNPARDVKLLKAASDGYKSWTIEDVEAFEAKYTIGTKPRLALALLLYTGQRRSDIIRLGPPNVKDGWLTFTQYKNRNSKPITLAIPLLPELKKIIEATPGASEGGVWLKTVKGSAYAGSTFSNWFAQCCKEAKVDGSAHGLRKAAASRLAEMGCSDREIMAITGHTTSKEVDRYTKGARQRVLAKSAMEKMGGIHLRAV